MKQHKTVIPFLLLIPFLFFSCSKKKTNKNELQTIKLEGEVQGTFYHITYLDSTDTDYHPTIKEILKNFDKDFSIFDSTSLISRINKNDSNVVLSNNFIYLFNIAQKISKQTNGAFDITVGPLIDLWGIHDDKHFPINQHMINKTMQYVGYKKIYLKNQKIYKEHPNITLDANAIAQGYSCDLIAEMLSKEGIENYMIEIGGEVLTKGKSPRGDSWKIGINKPIEDSTNTINEIYEVIQLGNMAMATSGNYRKFYYYNGKKIGHEIDPTIGWPAKNNLLSATVLAETCIEADAYATAFMVMGLVKSVRTLQNLSGVEAYFIFENKDGEVESVHTGGFKKYLLQSK